MTEYERELAEERAYLARVVDVARRQLDQAERDGAAGRAALTQSAGEMREQAEQMFLDLWSADSFEALANLNQLAQPIAVSRRTGRMRDDRAGALRAMLDAPYFARIDVRFDDGGDEERVYIGRATLRDEATREILIYDWRSPIAGLFYRHGVGGAHYDAPAGRVGCRVTRKRQFEIAGGALKSFFEADRQVQDRFLRQMLSQNASPTMKAIVETIQRDQDAAIRDVDHELLMVQGVAGSGKSAIALHRAAYLMYEGLASPLSAGDILILSPNALFERYIRGVLPELGERAVATSTLEALLSKVLGGAPVEGRAERFERLSLAQPADRGRMKDEIALKSSAAFVRRLNRFARELPRRHVEFQDVCYGGQMIATRQLLRARLLAGDGLVGTRLRRIELALWRDIGQLRPARRRRLVEYAARRPEHALETEACGRAYSILECAALARHIRRFARLNVRALYGRLMADEGLNAPPPGKLPLEDAAAIACLRLLVEEGGSLPRIRQVVVDEAQDLDEVQFVVLNRLFPRARFTVLGDFNQSLDRPADRSMYDRIAAILGRRSAALVELNKSFRCTLEILRFALRFVGAPGGVECFNRSGDAPIERAEADLGALCTAIADEVALCRARGMQSIALIARTAKSAAAWRGRLTDLGLGLADGEAGVPSGAFLVPLALAKGLEFDAVLVLDAQQYAGDGRLLYVACTRALHRLSLYTLLEGGDAAWRS